MIVTPALARQGNRFLRVLRVDEENEIHLEVPGSIHRQSVVSRRHVWAITGCSGSALDLTYYKCSMSILFCCFA